MTTLAGKRVLTGIKPTGRPHLGNYLGAIQPMIRMSRHAGEALVFIADLHALNGGQTAQDICHSTYEIAACYLALGLDVEKAIFYRQSDVPEIYALNTLLSNVTAKGLLNRAHAYKDKVAKNIEELGRDADDAINMGLFNYPLLMAADILLYNADLVPVGKDQKQHLEIARDIASSFNHHYAQGEALLTPPEPVIEEDVEAIPGTDGRKMSKSYGNVIPLFGEEKAIKKAVMGIQTDSRLPDEPKDADDIIVYQIYRLFAATEQTDTMKRAFAEGKLGYGDAKKQLLACLQERFAEASAEYHRLMENRDELDAALARGASRARSIARRQLASVSERMLGRVIELP